MAYDEMQILIEIEEEERKRKSEELKSYASMREFYANNPIEYVVNELGVKRETIDWTLLPEYKNHQWDGTVNPLVQIFEALVNNEWVGVESATGCSKTFIAACIALWFLNCFENSLVLTTAPKERQLETQIWKEIRYLYPRFNKGKLGNLEITMSEDFKKSYKWALIGFVSGTKADKDTEEKAQGFHAEHMLIILEETPGIPRSIINSFKATSQAPHNLILALGNPNHHLDNLHNFCKHPRTRPIRISGHDYPNIILNDATFIPGGKSMQGIKDILDDVHSVDHPRYLSRVRGISPAQSSDSLIRVEWCYRAAERDRTAYSKGLYALGIDVADSDTGDQAAIAFGKGAVLEKVDAFQCPDSNQLGKATVRPMMVTYNIDPSYCGVDGVGVGAGTINGLKEYGLKVANLKGGNAAVPDGKNEYKFNNLRSQMWWQMREDLNNDEICIPNDEELIADLCSPTYTDNDKVMIVESKDTIKKRLGRSPNKGDAAVYWNWVRKGRRKNKLSSSLI